MNLYEKLRFLFFLSWPVEQQLDFEQFFSWTRIFLQIYTQQNEQSGTEDVLSWRLGIMDCNTKMGNETAG